MAIETFKRYENKYRLSQPSALLLQDLLRPHMDPDPHNAGGALYPIHTLYYDTPGSDFIRASLQKPSYKEKLRLRSYGRPEMDSEVFVEIKKKVAGVVNKRRSAMRLSQAYAFLKSGELRGNIPTQNAQVLREIAYVLSRCELRPALHMSYERLAFRGERDLRVSFDRNILARRGDLRLESGAHGDPLLTSGEWLMEIKAAQSLPLWLCRLLSELRIYPAGFSKYGSAYTRELLRQGADGRPFVPARKPEIDLPAHPALA
ncbi:MAG: polyphosphate polymerase domain-containing protein [Christensenellaceae bacterium]|jgi:hypothetical protein|nr:polyphosphate polymerase domain-containing protein [Christensenellaceae bacterium]